MLDTYNTTYYICRMTFTVLVYDGNEWTPCVREDLIEQHDGDTRTLPTATFETLAEAEQFLETLRGMLHCGGDSADFRIVRR